MTAWRPLCMADWEETLWREADADTGGNHAVYPCADCLPAFRDEMQADGRCNRPSEVPGQIGLGWGAEPIAPPM